jgi:hypothetical protein
LLAGVLTFGIILIGLMAAARFYKSSDTDFRLMFAGFLMFVGIVVQLLRSPASILTATLGGLIFGACFVIGGIAYDYPRNEVKETLLLLIFVSCGAGVISAAAVAVKKGFQLIWKRGQESMAA